MIYLTVGKLEIDWGQNNMFYDHSALFRKADLQPIPYRYVEDDGSPIVEMKEGYSSELGTVLKRLPLLGYTSKGARLAFDAALADQDLKASPLTFEALAAALATVDVMAVKPDYGDDYGPGQFFSQEIFDRLELGRYVKDERSARYDLGLAMENLQPYWLLLLLGANPANLTVPVNWGFADVAENWTGRDVFVHDLEPASRFLIVTEGSLDAKLLEKAFQLLRPEIADFFSFIDMEEGYPFPGAGNLRKFSQGLVSIRIQNQVVVLYDNDAEGVARHADTAKLRLPPNMRVMRLPALTTLERFATVGPNGDSIDDINKRAAALECYLDLSWRAPGDPCVRWTSYNHALGVYQGELIHKDVYARRFMELRVRENGYDFSKIEVVLDSIVGECTSIAANRNDTADHLVN